MINVCNNFDLIKKIRYRIEYCILNHISKKMLIEKVDLKSALDFKDFL